MPTIRAGTVPFTIAARHELVLPDGAVPDGGFPLVVALHGYGESASRFRERTMGLVDSGLALLCLDGPFPVEMREEKPPRIGFAWYQYTGDQVEFRTALRAIGEHLDRRIAAVCAEHPVASSRVALLGYSQGGYLAGAHALSHPTKFKALVAIATRIKTELFEDAYLATVNLPVLAVHGRRDASIAIDRQREQIERLAKAGVPARLLEHEGGHGLRSEVIGPIGEFLRECL